ncbi:MAG: OmpH family outer membrane protein [Aureispira sp.]|nr:OmpH family outer membrane protein [Aureispira sp.]
MKNSKILIALFALIFLTAWSQKSIAQTIAYVETEKVVPEMESYKKAKSEVEAYGKQLQKVLEKKQKDLQVYYAAVTDSIKKGLMTPKEQQEAEAKLQKMQNELQQEAQAADRKLVEKEAELVMPVYKKFNEAVAKVAKENKYQYVLDKQLLLYSLGGIDATEKIRTVLGISW